MMSISSGNNANDMNNMQSSSSGSLLAPLGTGAAGSFGHNNNHHNNSANSSSYNNNNNNNNNRSTKYDDEFGGASWSNNNNNSEMMGNSRSSSKPVVISSVALGNRWSLGARSNSGLIYNSNSNNNNHHHHNHTNNSSTNNVTGLGITCRAEVGSEQGDRDVEMGGSMDTYNNNNKDRNSYAFGSNDRDERSASILYNGSNENKKMQQEDFSRMDESGKLFHCFLSGRKIKLILYSCMCLCLCKQNASQNVEQEIPRKCGKDWASLVPKTGSSEEHSLVLFVEWDETGLLPQSM